jgi:excisionase family DNA binding protein
VLLLTRRSISLRAWCDECAEHAPMLSPEEAANLTGLTARTIYRRVDDGRMHFTETADGLLLICRNSLHESN